MEQLRRGGSWIVEAATDYGSGDIRLGTGTLPMTLTPTNLYLCANTHAREGGRGAGERLHIHLRVHLKQAALRQLQQQNSTYI